MEPALDTPWMAPDVTRRRLPLYLLGPRDLPLSFAHRWWQWARKGPTLPPRAALDTEMFRLLVANARWLSGVASPSDPPWLALARATAAPVLHELRLAAGNEAAVWHELLLPTAEDGWHVGAILQVVQHRGCQGA